MLASELSFSYARFSANSCSQLCLASDFKFSSIHHFGFFFFFNFKSNKCPLQKTGTM